MSSLYTNGPARTRLLCSACRQIQTPRVGVTGQARLLCHDAWGRRQFATRRLNPNARAASPPPPPSGPRSRTSPSSPAPPRAPRPSGRDTSLSSREPARLVFSAQDVPPLQEWTNSLESLRNNDLTPLQCVDGACRYVSIATQRESQWRPKLEKEYGLPPYMLHWIGILLVSGNTAPRWRLGTHMLRSASELGYVPSILSLVRIFRTMPPRMFDRVANTIMYREAHARFIGIVNEGRDPNALTLQGIIHAKSVERGSDLKALAVFDRATKAWKRSQRGKESVGDESETDAGGKGTQVPAATSKRGTSSEATDSTASRDFALPSPREPRWDWEVSCVLGQAYILAKNPDTVKEAIKLFKVAALELDNPHGFIMLAKLMGGPRDSPERRTYLLKAAVSGDTEACREMGELETLAAARNDLSQNDRAELERLSKEWFRLADGEDLSAIIKAEDIGN